MKRLFFFQSKDKSKLYTNEILCQKDLLKGEIVLSNQIEWYVYNSLNNVVNKGISSSVAYAQAAIKQELIAQGAQFNREHRKYKI